MDDENINLVNPFLQNQCSQRVNRQFTIFYLNRNEVLPPTLNLYTYRSIPKLFTALDMTALDASGITQIQSQPVLALRGSGMLIGFIDTGIAYHTPAFRRSDGSSRIAGVWDQTEENGNPPQGFIYGREYTTEELDEALQQENPLEVVPLQDENGHGTMVAAIAAGTANILEGFSGAAPLADLAVVKLKPAKQNLKEFYDVKADAVAFQENDILAGMYYLEKVAERRGQPLIICFALGTNQGNHGGSSRLSDYLDDLAIKNLHAVCIAAGNEANKRHHYYGQITENREYDTVEINVGKNVTGFSMELWAKAPEQFAVAVVSPTGERMLRGPVRTGVTQEYRFLFEGTTVQIQYEVVGEKTRDELVFIQFKQPLEGIWILEVYPNVVLEGTFHIWLPVSEFLSGEVFFIRSNPDTTLTVPASSSLPMGVGGYQASNGSNYLDSGRGYSFYGAIKPDYTAPAVDVYTQNNRGNYVYVTGTSAAAAVASGAAAMMMEYNYIVRGNPTVNSVEIRNQLVNGAIRQENVLYPNREEGYGKLNVYEALRALRG